MNNISSSETLPALEEQKLNVVPSPGRLLSDDPETIGGQFAVVETQTGIRKKGVLLPGFSSSGSIVPGTVWSKGGICNHPGHMALHRIV